jgi:hypothetical protein
MNNLDFSPQNIVIWVCLLILIFLALRELATWYWKINKIVNLLEKIERNTDKNPTDMSRDKKFENHPHGFFGKDTQ